MQAGEEEGEGEAVEQLPMAPSAALDPATTAHQQALAAMVMRAQHNAYRATVREVQELEARLKGLKQASAALHVGGADGRAGGALPACAP